MDWHVLFHFEFEKELLDFSQTVRDHILAHSIRLKHFGPELGRPHVDTLNHSQFPNMKELRFKAENGAWRVAFAFDAKRRAILLVAGEQGKDSRKRFYRQLIQTADKRFKEHYQNLAKGVQVRSKSLEEIMQELPDERQKKIHAMAEELIEQEYTLQRIRKMRSLTQEQLAQALGIKQEGISRLEKRNDLLLSTLQNYIRALGGRLKMTVEFEDSPPMELALIPDSENKL